MIAVIPMMGLGERFSRNGYSEYKPFVKINTQPLITKVVTPLFDYFSHIYIICNGETELQLKSLFDNKQVTTIKLNSNTKGATETVLNACNFLPDNEQIACIDCDTIFHTTALDKLVNVNGNALSTFIDIDKTGLYSYVKIDTLGNIIDIQEKITISNIANAGVYIFENKKVLETSCINVINKHDGELYLSKAVQDCIQNNNSFKIVDISNEFDCCGTPYQLKEYSKKNMKTDHIICFDIDGTLIYDLYTNPTAIQKNVKFCNEAYQQGCKIILHSARGMVSKNGNLNEIENQRPYIEKVLKENSVSYHELILMKPYADVYIDDKAIPAHRDLTKETGLYLFQDHIAREHHTITVNGNRITKTGNLLNESFYYKNIPNNLISLFPVVYDNTKEKIVLQRLTQPTYSSLLLSQRLTKLDIDTLIESIDVIHQSIEMIHDIDLNWAYTTKVKNRLVEYHELYTSLGVDIKLFNHLSNKKLKCKYGRIHGDPVFTNVFIDKQYCKFIDARGEWDNILTSYGDIYYDYAKILQSLYGYDYVLHNETIQKSYLETLRLHFLDNLQIKHPEIDINELHHKVKMLLISLIPFHKENLDRCFKFIDLLDI
jgi:dTDP-glucose pyrophosphorylase